MTPTLKQQINFYLPEFRPVRQWMTAAHAIGCALVLLLLLMAYSIWAYWQSRTLSNTLLSKQQELVVLEETLNAIQAQRPQTNLVDIETELSQQKNALQRKEALLMVLGGADLGNNQGFSSQLYALGVHSSAEISLTGFTLKNGGRSLDMAGQARSTKAITQYVEKLQADAAFASTAFGVIRAEPTVSTQMRSHKQQPTAFTFIVAPRDAEGEIAPSPIRWNEAATGRGDNE
jgi:Tfp pilus assembly protein PilN